MITQEMHTAVVPYEPYSTLSLRVAEAIKHQIEVKPDSVLGLPTGRTPTDVYRVLCRWTRQGEMDWSSVRCFGLDEYCDAEEPESFRRYLELNLYKTINVSSESRFNPLFFDDYDQLIASKGGLDLTILGIGKNGHIAFNEPGTPINSYTHCVYLTESTRQANAEFFKRTQTVPHQAVTMGLQTILASKKIILMASGKSKKGILERALTGPISEDCPASYLQQHSTVQVMTDFDFSF